MPTSADVLNWVQTVGVILAIGATWFEIRARRKEQHFRNYLDGIAGFIDDTKLLVEHKELLPLYDYSDVDIQAKHYSELDDGQKTRVHYCDSIIARCETIWVACEEGWVPKDEWTYWRTWVRQLARSPDFRWTVNWVAADYAEDFVAMLKADIRAELIGMRTQLAAARSDPLTAG
jgi:hypothetical protein